MTVGEKVRYLRMKKDLSQNELARLADLAQPTIWRLEAGDQLTLKGNHAVRLANALGTSVDFLLSDREKCNTTDFVGHDDGIDELVKLYVDSNQNVREKILDYARFVNIKP